MLPDGVGKAWASLLLPGRGQVELDLRGAEDMAVDNCFFDRDIFACFGIQCMMEVARHLLSVLGFCQHYSASLCESRI